MEIWKKIEEIPFMEVSNYGNFRTMDRIVEKIRMGKLVKAKYKGKNRKLSTDNNGYLKLVTHTNGVAKAYVAHRLVAKYFLDDFDETLEVDHKDNNRSNNNVNNLQMVSRLENVRKPTTLEKIRNYLKNMSTEEKKRRAEKAKKTMALNGIKNGRKKKPVVKIGNNSIEIIEDISLLDNFSRSNISCACNGYSSKKNPHYYKGFEWYHLDEYNKMLGN